MSPSEMKLKEVIEPVRETEKQQLEEKQKLVMEGERRQERVLQALKTERQREIETQKEITNEKRNPFMERARKEQMQRIVEFEGGTTRGKGKGDRLSDPPPDHFLLQLFDTNVFTDRISS
jgi:hypothetical protein